MWDQFHAIFGASLQRTFGTAAQTMTWDQECARAAVIFVYGLLLVRVIGRRVFGKWSALDIIVSIIIGSNLSRALTGSALLLPTLIATTFLLVLHWIVSKLAARFRAVSRIVEGRSILLGEQGRVDERICLKFAISEADLNEALRQSDLEDLDGMRKITLEPSGKLSVLK